MNTAPVDLGLDADFLHQMDAEYASQFDETKVPDIQLAPLDPATDPFGRSYDWLNVPIDPYESDFATLVLGDASAWREATGPEFRKLVLSNSLAAGTDEEAFRKWAREAFPAMCFASGEDGDALLEMLKSEGGMHPAVVKEVSRVLESRPEYAALSEGQRMAAALIVIDELMPKTSQR